MYFKAAKKKGKKIHAIYLPKEGAMNAVPVFPIPSLHKPLSPLEPLHRKTPLGVSDLDQ